MSVRARSSLVAVFVLLMAVLLVAGAPGATATSERGQQQRDPAAERRQQVMDFWTAERIRNATPRELTVAPPRDPQAKPSWAGGGGDDGGDTTTWTTTGAQWPDEPDTTVKRTTGKAFFKVGTSTYVCSGSVVVDTRGEKPDVVLTAGHCVHDGDGKTWASMWMFVPDYDHNPAQYTSDGSFCADTRFGCWVADELVTTTEWANSGDFDHDAGFAVVNDGGKTATSTDDLSGTVRGHHAISFDTASKTVPTYAFGYPHASPYDGTELVYCAGNSTADPYGYDTRGLECDMTGGSSGGPWYLADGDGIVFDGAGVGTAISVNSYKYRIGKYSKYMYGPVFGTQERAAYDLANSTSTSGGGAVKKTF